MSPDSPALEVAGVTVEEPPDEVLERLERDRKGQLKACLTNVIHILDLDPAYEGRLWLDVFRRRVMFDGEPITDEDETALNFDLSQRYGIGPSTRLVGEAVRYVARERQRHPVQEYLSELTWDGVVSSPAYPPQPKPSPSRVARPGPAPVSR